MSCIREDSVLGFSFFFSLLTMFLLKNFYQTIFAEFLILIPEMLKASLAKIIFWSS